MRVTETCSVTSLVNIRDLRLELKQANLQPEDKEMWWDGGKFVRLISGLSLPHLRRSKTSNGPRNYVRRLLAVIWLQIPETTVKCMRILYTVYIPIIVRIMSRVITVFPAQVPRKKGRKKENVPFCFFFLITKYVLSFYVFAKPWIMPSRPHWMWTKSIVFIELTAQHKLCCYLQYLLLCGLTVIFCSNSNQ